MRANATTKGDYDAVLRGEQRTRGSALCACLAVPTSSFPWRAGTRNWRCSANRGFLPDGHSHSTKPCRPEEVDAMRIATPAKEVGGPMNSVNVAVCFTERNATATQSPFAWRSMSLQPVAACRPTTSDVPTI